MRRVGLLCALIVVLVYSGMPAEELTFDNAFVIGDDTRLRIFSAESVRAILVFDYWWPSMASNLYRPLTTLSFWFEYSFLGYGAAPLGYQIGNALLHWVGCLLLFAVGRKLGLSAAWAFGAVAVFAAHPVATEVVPNIVGRSDLFTTIAVLAGTWFYLTALERPRGASRVGRLALMGACGLVGVMAKESAIVLVAVIGAHGLLRIGEWGRGGEDRARWLGDAIISGLCLLPAVGFFFVTRWIFSANAGVTDHPFIDNPLMVEGLLVSRLSALAVWGMQVASLFAPLALSNDYSFNAIPVAVPLFGNTTAWWGWGFLAVAAGITAICWRAFRAGSPALFLLLAYFVAMLPTSNLLVRIGSIRADRFHYMPSAFFWLLLALGAAAIVARLRARGARGGAGVRALLPLGVLAAAWVLCVGMLAHFRCYDWRSNLALWTSALSTHPGSAKVLSASGNVRVMAQQNEDNERLAIIQHMKSLDLFRDHGVPKYHWPLQAYSDLLACYLNIYDLMIARGAAGPEADAMLDAAFRVYAEAREVEAAAGKRWKEQYGEEPRNTIRLLDVLSRNYALALSRRGRHDEAVAALDEVLRLLPLKVQNRQTYVDVLYGAGRYREALGESILIRIMEPDQTGDLERLAVLARLVDPDSTPLVPHEGEKRINLQDPFIRKITREQLIRYRRILLKNGLYLDAARVDRVARYFYGITDWLPR